MNAGASMTLQEVQRRLVTLGFDAGPADGIMGPSTRRAIKAFQVASGLAADGIVGPLTAAALAPADNWRDDEPVPPASPSPGADSWPRQRDVMAFYGGVGMNQTRLSLPYPMRLAWDLDTKIRAFSIHQKAHDSAARALEAIAVRFSPSQREALGLDLFGGCLNVRRMRGGRSYSMHSWGIAIDFDPERNQLRWGSDRARLAQPDAIPFWEIWEGEGWVSLGRKRGYDWMHIQAARL